MSSLGKFPFRSLSAFVIFILAASVSRSHGQTLAGKQLPAKGDVVRTSPSDVKQKADALVEELKQLDGMNDGLRVSLDVLRTAIISARKQASLDLLKSTIDEAKAVAGAIDTKIAVIDNEALSKLQAVIDELERLERTYPTVAAIRQSRALAVTLTTPGLIQPYRDLQVELQTLVKEADKIVGAGEPRINIVRGIFGDLESKSRHRTCDATAAIQKACQNQISCTIPGDFGTTLCTEDPVPNAAPRDKGAHILFQCLDRLQQTYSPLAMPDVYQEGSGTYSVVLKNASQSFSCVSAPMKNTLAPGTVK